MSVYCKAVDNREMHDNIMVYTEGDEHFFLLCTDSVFALLLSVSEQDIKAVGSCIAAVVGGKKRKKHKFSGGGRFRAADGVKKGTKALEFTLSFIDPHFDKEADTELVYFGFETDELSEFAEKLCSYDKTTISIRKRRMI